MPISADRFEKIDEEGVDPRPGTNADRILAFFEKHADQAFTQTEIAKATGIKRGSVGPTLVRLRERGRVDHRGKYWRISDHVRSIDATTNHTGDVAASYEESPFDYDDWQEHAVDPRDERE